jgi:transposase-like protein
MITGFFARLKSIDLDEPRICGRLVEAGLRAARKARDADSDAQFIHTDAVGPIAPIHPWDHPDLVLARAVAAAVLDADEANLIAATRLETATVAQVADQMGIAPSTASAWRARAEKRLAEAIVAGELAFVPLRPRREARRRRWANTANGSNGASVGRADTAGGGSVGRLLGANSPAPVLLGTQRRALGGKASDREAAGVGAPGIGTRPA